MHNDVIFQGKLHKVNNIGHDNELRWKRWEGILQGEATHIKVTYSNKAIYPFQKFKICSQGP